MLVVVYYADFMQDGSSCTTTFARLRATLLYFHPANALKHLVLQLLNLPKEKKKMFPLASLSGSVAATESLAMLLENTKILKTELQ